MLGFTRRFLGGGPKRPVQIDAINALESQVAALDDAGLRRESDVLKEKATNGESLDELLPRAYALVRESAKRVLGQRHFDAQLWGGLVLHRGAIAEMLTGEGKTLTATLATYLNALPGNGAHVITVNDYLAKRDAVWMGQVYHLLGLKTACILHNAAFIYDPQYALQRIARTNADGTQTDAEKELARIDKERDEKGTFLVEMEFLRPVPRREAYEADITYGTNHEFGFDYLRDNLAQDVAGRVQRTLNFAIIDEVDSILIDEARTPLIISIADKESSEYYKVFARAVKNLNRDADYVVDEKLKSVEITEPGIDKVERMSGVKNMYAVENIRLVHYLEASLKAKALFERDKDYVVKNGEIIIVDQFTGRLMPGRRYSAGLHQAIEAKESVFVKEETRTYAQITIQNYFRLYKKISGMTGTAQTSAEEFHKVYNLEVESIPPNRPLVRRDEPDLIFKDSESKYRAIVREVKERHKVGQPVLIGTVSIEKNELLGKILKEEGLPFEILNAKNHEREGAIIAQAGRLGAITVATNMAGRGVDIVLGGKPAERGEAEKVREVGGLYVIGTERHEARRIDNQLRGRSGRQGDPGASQFFLSFEDDLLRVFGGDRMKSIMTRFNLQDEIPSTGIMSRMIAQAQSRVEGFNFDSRKHLLEYDDVLNKQRINYYDRRLKILNSLDKPELAGVVKALFENYLARLEKSFDAQTGMDMEEVIKLLVAANIITKQVADSLKNRDEVMVAARDAFERKLAAHKNIPLLGRQMLGVLDFLWMNHLEDIDAVTESVRIRAYGQRDPLVEYRRESHKLFEDLRANFEAWVFNNAFKSEVAESDARNVSPAPNPAIVSIPKHTELETGSVGRNDPCPCGSCKKYKKCHGK